MSILHNGMSMDVMEWALSHRQHGIVKLTSDERMDEKDLLKTPAFSFDCRCMQGQMMCSQESLRSILRIANYSQTAR